MCWFYFWLSYLQSLWFSLSNNFILPSVSVILIRKVAFIYGFFLVRAEENVLHSSEENVLHVFKLKRLGIQSFKSGVGDIICILRASSSTVAILFLFEFCFLIKKIQIQTFKYFEGVDIKCYFYKGVHLQRNVGVI